MKGIMMTQSSGSTKLSVSWGRCSGDTWCSFAKVDLSHQAFGAGGVYLIWHGGPKPRVVYVGQAAVFRDRLTEHRTDQRILAYSNSVLYVTWAPLRDPSRDGAEVYLANRYSPLVGDRHPDATPTAVNSPWD
jgi:hypothetical protein